MFADQTAWFSASVDENTKKLWQENGGTETDLKTAMFVFSSDSSSPDTERVFRSAAYESQHLAVFHSSFINDCVHAGDKAEVVIGQYFLPPQDILEKIRKQMTLCWDELLPHLQNSTPEPRMQTRRRWALTSLQNRSKDADSPRQELVETSSKSLRHLANNGSASQGGGRNVSSTNTRSHSHDGVAQTRQQTGSGVAGTSKRPNEGHQFKQGGSRDPEVSTANHSQAKQRRNNDSQLANERSIRGCMGKETTEGFAEAGMSGLDVGRTGRNNFYTPTAAVAQAADKTSRPGPSSKTRDSYYTKTSDDRHSSHDGGDLLHHGEQEHESGAAQKSSPEHSKDKGYKDNKGAGGTKSLRGKSTLTVVTVADVHAPPTSLNSYTGQGEGVRASHIRTADSTVDISKLPKVRTTDLILFIPGQDGAISYIP